MDLYDRSDDSSDGVQYGSSGNHVSIDSRCGCGYNKVWTTLVSTDDGTEWSVVREPEICV